METSGFNTLTNNLHRAEQALRKVASEFKQWLPGASWLEILLICIPLALAVTLLPVVLTLFVIGLLLQWLLTPRKVEQPEPQKTTQENKIVQEANHEQDFYNGN